MNVMTGRTFHVAGIILALLLVVVMNLVAESRCKLVRDSIGEKEKLLASLEKDRDREDANWQQMKSISNLERALVRPADCVALWRERAFEIRTGDEWVSGRFDRVVFMGEGDNRQAMIYDFKTNAKRTQESEADFLWRLSESYRGQMAAYRAALARLTGISDKNISCFLLSTAIKKVCQIITE